MSIHNNKAVWRMISVYGASMISYLLIAIFILLSAFLLIYSADAFILAGMGLTLWLERMVPTLLPFMILSGIMTGLNLQYPLCKPLKKPFEKLFHVSESGTYCIFMGYLCGFPMGAFCVANLCQSGHLNKKTAQYLVSFCNNIGPIYFYSFALSMAGFRNPTMKEYLLLTFGMYGVPILYGILTASRKQNVIGPPFVSHETKSSLFHATDSAINRSGMSILRLCGYMVLFNVLMLLVYRSPLPVSMARCIHCFVEISGGLNMMQTLTKSPFYITLFSGHIPIYPLVMLTALSFGGISCIGQTSVFLHEAGLSVGHYVKSRILIALSTMIYYIICFSTGILTLN